MASTLFLTHRSVANTVHVQIKATEAYEVPEDVVKAVAELVKDSEVVELDADGSRVKRKEVRTFLGG